MLNCVVDTFRIIITLPASLSLSMIWRRGARAHEKVNDEGQVGITKDDEFCVLSDIVILSVGVCERKYGRSSEGCVAGPGLCLKRTLLMGRMLHCN